MTPICARVRKDVKVRGVVGARAAPSARWRSEGGGGAVLAVATEAVGFRFDFALFGLPFLVVSCFCRYRRGFFKRKRVYWKEAELWAE